MEFCELMKKRIGKRSFSDKQISDQDIREIVKDAQRSPSWANAQATHVYVAVGDTLKKIKAEHFERVDKAEKGNSEIPTVSRNNLFRHNIENSPPLFTDRGENFL